MCRIAVEDDFGDILGIRELYNGIDNLPSRWNQWIKNAHNFPVVAIIDGKIVSDLCLSNLVYLNNLSSFVFFLLRF